MTTDMKSLLEQFESGLAKTAAKEKVGRKQLSKDLEKSKARYRTLKSALDSMEAEAAKLNKKIEENRSVLQGERKKMVKLHDALQKMDLADASDCVFYDDDTGYIVGGKEVHLDLNDAGDITITPMRAYRRSLREKDLSHSSEELSDLMQDLEEVSEGNSEETAEGNSEEDSEEDSEKTFEEFLASSEDLSEKSSEEDFEEIFDVLSASFFED